MEKNTGKVREKSGNFVIPEKWEPCLKNPCSSLHPKAPVKSFEKVEVKGKIKLRSVRSLIGIPPIVSLCCAKSLLKPLMEDRTI